MGRGGPTLSVNPTQADMAGLGLARSPAFHDPSHTFASAISLVIDIGGGVTGVAVLATWKDADFLKLALWCAPSSAAAGLQKSDNKCIIVIIIIIITIIIKSSCSQPFPQPQLSRSPPPPFAFGCPLSRPQLSA